MTTPSEPASRGNPGAVATSQSKVLTSESTILSVHDRSWAGFGQPPRPHASAKASRSAKWTIVLMMLSIMAVACASESDQSAQNAADNPSENATSEDAIESALSPSVGSGTAELSEPNAEVGRVVDGDTIVAMIDGAEERIRFIGIDTPESVKPNSPVECFGKEASAHLAEYLPPGTPLVLVRDVEARDRYDRLLAYVYRASDGLFVNMQMMLDGYAQPATYPPNVAHTDQFLAASRQAREAELGLWSACEGE